MEVKKNIIVKETIFWIKKNQTDIWYVSNPKDQTGSFVSSVNIEKAFVFTPDSIALQRHHEGKITGNDNRHYGEFTSEVEWMETDQEETPHWENGWKTETKIVFTKNGIVKELVQ